MHSWKLVALFFILSATFAHAYTDPKAIQEPAEHEAYMTAHATEDPAQKAAAMETFVQRYPSSVMKVEALEEAMKAYNQIENQPKVQEMAHRLLEIDPNHMFALAFLTSSKQVEALEKTDPESMAELRRLGEHGIQQLPHWEKPSFLSESDFDHVKYMMTGVFYRAVGFAALEQKEFSAARDAYLKVLEVTPINLDDVLRLGRAELRMKPQAKEGFWHIAKAVSLAGDNPAFQQQIAAYGKTKYSDYHGSDSGWDAIITKAATEAAPPPGFADAITAAPTQ